MTGKTTLVVDLDADELALRIAIACIGARPPIGTKAKDALDQMDRETIPGIPPMGKGFRDAAKAALLYFAEQTAKASKVQ